MKKADIVKEITYVLSVYPNAGIEWNIDKTLLFVFFKGGSFSGAYRKIESIRVDDQGIRINMKSKSSFQWRCLTNQLWFIQYS